MCCVAVSGYGIRGDGCFQFGYFLLGEAQFGGGDVLFEVGAALGAGDGEEVVSLGEDPGESQLAGLDAFAVGDGADAIDEQLVLAGGVSGEAWVAGSAEVLVVELGGVGERAGEEAAAEGAVGDEADAELANGGEYLGFNVALPEGVLGLESGDGVDFVGAADGGRGGFGEAEVLHLSRVDELRHGSDGVFDGSVGIDAVLVVEVDVIDAETLQGGVAGLLDVLRFAGDGPEAGIIFLADVGELGREEDLVTARFDGAADELLVVTDTVHVGGVEEVAAEVECAEDGGGGFSIVALAVELTHTHAAETHAGDDCALFAENTSTKTHWYFDAREEERIER